MKNRSFWLIWFWGMVIMAPLLGQQPMGTIDSTAMIPRLDSLGRYYLEVGQLDSSAYFFSESVRLRKVAGVKGDKELVQALIKLFLAAKALDKGGKNFFKSAKDLLVAYPYLVKESAEEDTLVFATTLTITSRWLMEIGEYETAGEFARMGVELARKEAATSIVAQTIYLGGLSSWATALLSEKKYLEVEKIYLERQESMRTFSWDTTTYYANALNDLGWLYNQSDRYAEAIPPLKQSVLLKRNAGIATREQKEALITTLGNLGSALVEHSDYEEAEEVYQERVQLQQEISGDTSYAYAEAIDNLGWAYGRMGRHFEAINLLEKSLELKKDSTLAWRAGTMITLARAYRNTNRFEEALKLLIPIRQDSVLSKGINFQISFLFLNQRIMDTGSTYQEEKNQWIIKKLEKEYLDLVDTLRNLQKPFNLLVTMNDLGVLYYRWGKFDQAKVWYEKSLELTEKLYSKEHVEHAMTSSNLGWVHIKLGNLDKAEKYFKDCLQIRTQKIPESFLTAESHSDLAWLYYLMEKLAESATSYRSAFNLLIEQFEKAFVYTSEQEKATFIEKLTDQVEGYYTLLHRYPDQVDPALALDIALRWKSTAMQSARELKRIVSEQRDTALSAKYEAFTQARSVLAEVYLGRRQEQPGLAAHAEALERDLAQIPAFRDALPQFSVSTEALQSALQPSEALVEFVSYPLYDNQACKCGDSLWYGALVLRPEWPKPRFLPLFEEQALGGLLNDTIQRTIDIVQQLYPAKARGAVTANTSEPVDLHALIWQPLDSLLGGVEVLWLSSAGLLNRLNLGAIANQHGEIAGKRYQIRQVVSARAILQAQEETAAVARIEPPVVQGGRKRKKARNLSLKRKKTRRYCSARCAMIPTMKSQLQLLLLSPRTQRLFFVPSHRQDSRLTAGIHWNIPGRNCALSIKYCPARTTLPRFFPTTKVPRKATTRPVHPNAPGCFIWPPTVIFFPLPVAKGRAKYSGYLSKKQKIPCSALVWCCRASMNFGLQAKFFLESRTAYSPLTKLPSKTFRKRNWWCFRPALPV